MHRALRLTLTLSGVLLTAIIFLMTNIEVDGGFHVAAKLVEERARR